MRFSKEAAALRALADALDREARVAHWIENYAQQASEHMRTNADYLRIEWSLAGSCTGYADVQAIVRRDVAMSMDTLFERARDTVRGDVLAARDAVAKALREIEPADEL